MSIDKEMEALIVIIEACEKLGWAIAVPDEDEVDGLIIGTEEYINKILDK
jgi:hypothetical protein